MANELFCLKWNNYTSNIITELDSLRADGDLVDVTILCDGRKIAAHKVILSACSSYFRTIFRENPCQHPVVILKDINYEDIEAVLCFVYQGTVYISKSRMESFLKTAESLQIKGLAGASNMMGDNEENVNIPSEESSKAIKRSKPLPPLASVSTNVPVTTPPVSKNPPSSKRKKLVPNINQVEDNQEEDPSLMNTVKNQNQDQRSRNSSLSRQDTQSSAGVADNDSMDLDEESNAYNNTAYSSSADVEDDTQLQCRDDNEENEDDEDSSSVAEPHRPVGEIIIKQEPTPILNNSKFYSENMSAQCSSGTERTTEKKSTTLALNSNQDLNTGHHSYAEEDLPSERLSRRPCPLCLKVISNKSNLLKHIRIRHNTDYYNQAKCPKCYKNFKNKYSLRAHINIYHKETSVVVPSTDPTDLPDDRYSFGSIIEPPPMMGQTTSMVEQYIGIMSTTSMAPESVSQVSLHALNSPVFLSQPLSSSAMPSAS